jgi:preprotein translocase subunit YajC
MRKISGRRRPLGRLRWWLVSWLLTVPHGVIYCQQDPPPAEGGGAQPQSPGIFESLFGGSMGLPLVMLLMFLVLYFLMIRPESRRQKARDAMLKSLKKGDNVLTAAGIIGKVHRVDEKEVVLQVDKDSSLKMRFLRSAITEILPGEEKSGAKDGDPAPAQT